MILVDANLLVYAHVTSLPTSSRAGLARRTFKRPHSGRITVAHAAQLRATGVEPPYF